MSDAEHPAQDPPQPSEEGASAEETGPAPLGPKGAAGCMAVFALLVEGCLVFAWHDLGRAGAMLVVGIVVYAYGRLIQTHIEALVVSAMAVILTAIGWPAVARLFGH